MLHKTEGIVIRTTDYGETNKIITILSRENGKIAVMARGAKRPKSRFASSTQLFIYGTFIYQKSQKMGSLSQSDIIDSFKEVRNDLMLTAYGAYIVELIDKFTDDNEKNPYLFELLYQLLHHLNERADGEILIRILEIKMLAFSGSSPTLHECAHCGRTDLPFVFSLRFGGALCKACSHEDRYHLPTSPSVMKLLKLFQQINPSRIGKISVKTDNKKQLKEILELYYKEYVGVHLKSKRFLDQMEKFSQQDVDS
ncbi:DNA repair protein RecO [Salipaludibacillus sp. LMS25]|uniref:DNA repair protein RecO n=1 Tax=Salipaludibacillus sp. LMS25 TaxID=2924031 RepID=UPI0020D04099|nr:DNA repair protein RecO [Salipaludibacillus sp. LMS25]UTR17070.1 DNA repair protein RecO [Salipaludibacillus sp. LMS25]